MINEMIEKARAAGKQLEEFSQEQVDAIVREIAKTVFDNAEYYAKLAVEETGMGVFEDKIKKNQGKSRIIWNSLKGQKIGRRYKTRRRKRHNRNCPAGRCYRSHHPLH